MINGEKKIIIKKDKKYLSHQIFESYIQTNSSDISIYWYIVAQKFASEWTFCIKGFAKGSEI